MGENSETLAPFVFQAQKIPSEIPIMESSNGRSNYAEKLERLQEKRKLYLEAKQAKHQEKQKKQKEEFDKIFSHRDVLALLLHAFQCAICQDPDCCKVKEMYCQSCQCSDMYCYGACDLCAKVWYFLRLHAESCKNELCYVPRCGILKLKSRESVQPLQTSPQLLRVTETLRTYFTYPSPVKQPLKTIPWQEFDKMFSHRDVLELLLHAFQCELPQCQDRDCLKVNALYGKGLQRHGLRCVIDASGGGCNLCKAMWYFLQRHARNCQNKVCYVPHCRYLKLSMDSTPVSPAWQTFPHQAASTDQMTRKRAAEAKPDTMDEHQFSRSDQNPLKAQKIRMGSSGSSSVTTSTSLTETVNGTHQFKITGYSLLKGLGVGKYVASDTFEVGGHKWEIHFYPDGKDPEDNAAYVSMCITRVSEGTDVRALFELTLLDQSGKERHKVHTHFENGPYMLKYRGSMWGYKRFFLRTTLETSDYLKDDCLSVHCKVGVVKTHTEGVKTSSIIQVPASDIVDHRGEHLESLQEKSDTQHRTDLTEQATEDAVHKVGDLAVVKAEVDAVDEKGVVVKKMGDLSIEEVVLNTLDEHQQHSVDDEWTLV